MDTKPRSTRRGILGKGIVAAIALGGLAWPKSSLAKADPPPTKREPDREYYARVFYDSNGKAYKICYYDKDGSLLYCDRIG